MRGRATTVILIALGAVVALVVNATVFAGVVAYRAYKHGTAIVKVQEKRPDGVDLWIPVPLGLVSTAMRWMPAHDLPPMDPEVARMVPSLRGLADEIDRMPDAVLVEIESGDEWVRVAKEGGRIVVDVDNDDARVHVTLPHGALPDLAAHLEWLARNAPRAPQAPAAPPAPMVPPAPEVPVAPAGVV